MSAQWLEYDIHVGGPTALELHGHAHYLPLGNREVAYLYSDEPPAWLKRLGLQTELHIRTKKLFTDSQLGVQVARPGELTASNLSPWEFPVRMATPERAILEAIDELPRHVDFRMVDRNFEGLTSLRPRLLNPLLRSCRSVKVKRLFFVYADNHGHAWRNHLDATSYDLGSGKRSLGPGGRLHPRYHITVPEDLLPPAEDETSDP